MAKISHRYQDPAYIISAFRSSFSQAQNLERHKVLRGYLHAAGLPFKEVHGCYKGERERSFLVTGDGKAIEETIYQLAKRFDQECVMYLTPFRDAYFCTPNGTFFDKEKLPGRFQAVDEHELETLDGWTYCPLLKTYYSVV